MMYKYLLKIITYHFIIFAISSCVVQEHNRKRSIFPINSFYIPIFTQGWHYQTNSYDENGNDNLSNKTVQVTKFKDLRQNHNVDFNALLLLPLFPYGFIKYDKPEFQNKYVSGLKRGYHLGFDVLMTNALADELKSANIFKDVINNKTSQKTDYYVKGSIISTKYNGKTLTYGLSGVGPLLWFVGFPAIYFTNDIEIDLSLIDSKTKEVVFQKRYKKEFSKLDWMYYIHNDIRYDLMLEDLYKKFVDDLQNNNFD